MPGHGVRSGPGAEPGQRGCRAFVRAGLLLVGCVVVFTIVIKVFVAQAFLVPTASMADTEVGSARQAEAVGQAGKARRATGLGRVGVTAPGPRR